MKKIKEKLKNEFELYIVLSFAKERKSPRESASQKERKRFSNVITLTIKELKVMEQIALLLNKEVGAADWLIRALIDKKLIRVDQLTRKNIHMLSSLGNRKLGKKSKTIKINYNELIHQDLLIKWLCKQNDIVSYQTEKELKAESYREKGYPDLLVHYENKVMIIEFERTRKTKQRMRQKFDGLRHYCKNGYDVLFLVPNENMKKFIDKQIKVYNWKLGTFKTQIFQL